MARKPIQPGEQQYETKILVCDDCDEEFVFTADAQQHLASRGITEVSLCKTCYSAKKRRRAEIHPARLSA